MAADRKKLKNPEISTYFNSTKDVDKIIKEQIKTMGCYSPPKGTVLLSKNTRTTSLRDFAGILKLKTSQFKSKFRAVQNLFKKSVLLDELDGNLSYISAISGQTLTKKGKLFTGKFICLWNNQLSSVTKVKRGKPVSELQFRAGILPYRYGIYEKSKYSCSELSFNEVKLLDCGKLYTKKFPQIHFG